MKYIVEIVPKWFISISSHGYYVLLKEGENIYDFDNQDYPVSDIDIFYDSEEDDIFLNRKDDESMESKENWKETVKWRVIKLIIRKKMLGDAFKMDEKEEELFKEISNQFPSRFVKGSRDCLDKDCKHKE